MIGPSSSPPPLRSPARVELLPDALVGPVVDGVVGLDLQVHALQRGGARADEREAAVVQRVDELVRRRRRLDEDPEPGEGVDALELRAHALRDRLAGRAPVAVAAGHDVAGELLELAAALQPDLVGEGPGAEADGGAIGLDPVDLDRLRLPDDLAARLDARRVEILDDLVLPVERDRPTARELREVDAVMATRPAQLDAVVHRALLGHPVADAGVAQQPRDVVPPARRRGWSSRLDSRLRASSTTESIPSSAQEVREEQSGGSPCRGSPPVCAQSLSTLLRGLSAVLEERVRFPYIERSRQEEP